MIVVADWVEPVPPAKIGHRLLDWREDFHVVRDWRDDFHVAQDISIGFAPLCGSAILTKGFTSDARF